MCKRSGMEDRMPESARRRTAFPQGPQYRLGIDEKGSAMTVKCKRAAKTSEPEHHR